MKSALADRGSHVCKSAGLWWETRRALPLKRRWRRTRPVPGRGPFESVERLRDPDTRVAKRQRRRLLSAPPQVRVLPLVHIPRGPRRALLAGARRGRVREPSQGSRETRQVPIGQLAQAAAPSRRKPGFESLWGRPARVDQQRGHRSFKAETAGQHRPRVRARVQWRTARLLNETAQVRILPGAHLPSRSDRNGRRATNAETGGSNPPEGAETSASVVQQENAGPTCRRRACNSLRSHCDFTAAPVSIWRGYPAVYRARRVRFPSGAREGAWRNGRRGELKPRPDPGSNPGAPTRSWRNRHTQQVESLCPSGREGSNPSDRTTPG
jgi:hypothetical protein